ncbi:hypothetical protein TNCV_1698191 [Trichonephila clavipes]|nr:hypothetical protein TNCV_1698191 [Trichonephila clavipes]
MGRFELNGIGHTTRLHRDLQLETYPRLIKRAFGSFHATRSHMSLSIYVTYNLNKRTETGWTSSMTCVSPCHAPISVLIQDKQQKPSD